MKAVMIGVLFVLLTAGSAAAQIGTGGTIRGVVRDDQGGVLPGVTVSATAPNVPGTRTTISQADGQYRLLELPPGVYDVVAELQGFSKHVQSGVEVRAGLSLGVDIQLKIGSVTETVVVSGEPPLLETAKPIQAVNVAGDFQRTLPLTTRRDTTDALEVTPGVTARNFINNNGKQVYMLRGTDVEQHVVQVDGIDMGSSRQGRPDYLQVGTGLIADSQVKTGGADAASPIGLGVVLNIATRAGSNALRGGINTFYQDRKWNADNDPKGVPTNADGRQLDIALGGPVVRDRVFFFGTIGVVNRNSQISRTPDQLTNIRSVIPDWEPFDNRTRTWSYFVKGTAKISDRHSFNAYHLQQGGTEESNQSTNSKRFSTGSYNGIGLAAKLFSVWNSTTTTSLGIGYNNLANNPSLGVFDGLDYGGPRILIYNRANASAGRLVGDSLLITTGNNQNFNVNRGDKLTIQGDLNWFKTGLGGSHELQVGFFAQPRQHLTTNSHFLNNGFILEELALRVPGDLNSGYVPFHRQYSDPSKLDVLTAESDSQDYAVYVQDSWKPRYRLTVLGGLRIDQVKAQDDLFGVDMQSSFEIGPRAGITYALTSNNRNILHATFSRIAARPEPNYIPELGGTVRLERTDVYDTARNGTWATTLVTPAATAVAAGRSIDPERHQPFTDEALVGYRSQLPGQISIDATFIRRYYRDMPASLDINGIYANGVFAGYEDQSQNAILLQTNNKWNTPVYTGLEFVASQRTARSQLLLGYTRGFQHISGTWQPDDPGRFIQPDAFPNNRGIGTIRGDERNSLSGTAGTRNPMWLKHAVRLAGSINIPYGLSIASNLNYFSGPYTGPIVTFLTAPDPKFGPSTITLPNGRVVSNPLATTVRFAYENRGTGQLQAPALGTWNAKISRQFTAGPRKLDIALNILNITNRGTLQEFLGGSGTSANTGSNVLGSSSFAYGPDGQFRGQNRQAARTAQLSVQFDF